MFSALIKGIRQLGDPTTRRVVWSSAIIAILSFLILHLCIEMALRHTTIFQTGWMETMLDALGRLVSVVLTWLLFPAVISAVVGFFLGHVAGAVESRHYPALPPIKNQPLMESLLTSIKFLVILVALNVALLFFIFTGPLYLLLYYIANGYLISREFFELVSLRRIEPAAARALRKKSQTSLLLVGSAFAFLMTVPIVNLLTPIIATATMVHLFENWRDHDNVATVAT